MTDRATIHLSDLCDLVAEQVNPHKQPDDIYVGLEHVASRRFIRSGAGKASDVRSSKSSFKPGDVLYGKLRPYLDKAVLAHDEGICTTELLVLRAKEEINPRFLVGVVHSPAFVEHAISGTTGVQHPRTSWSHIQEFQLPEFTRDEQNRIAEFLWLIYEAIAACESSIETSHILKRAAMRTLFTRGLHGEAQKETEIGPMPKSWKLNSLGTLFDIVQGFSLKGNLSDDDQGIPFLRTSNVYWGRMDVSVVSRMRIDPALVRDRTLKRGDLLICEGGEIGRAAVWNGEIGNCTFQNHLHRLRPAHPACINSKFTMSWLEEGFCHRYVYEGAGNRTTIPNLSRARLAELLMPVPTLDEQHEIVTVLDTIDRKIDLHRRKRAVLDDLFKALLHKLMTNEIRIADLDLSVINEAFQSNGLPMSKKSSTIFMEVVEKGTHA